MIILKNRKWGKICRFDEEKIQVTPIEEDSCKSCGWFLQENNDISCMYFIDRKMYFQFNKKIIELNEHITSKIQDLNTGKRSFVIQKDNIQLFEHEYDPPNMKLIVEQDPTFWGEEEDFDFFLLIHNVISDVDRQQRIIDAHTCDQD